MELDKRLPFYTCRMETVFCKNNKDNIITWEYYYPYFSFYNEKGRPIKRVNKEILEHCKNWLIKNGSEMGHGYSEEEIKKMMEQSKTIEVKN